MSCFLTHGLFLTLCKLVGICALSRDAHRHRLPNHNRNPNRKPWTLNRKPYPVPNPSPSPIPTLTPNPDILNRKSMGLDTVPRTTVPVSSHSDQAVSFYILSSSNYFYVYRVYICAAFGVINDYLSCYSVPTQTHTNSIGAAVLHCLSFF